MSSIRIIPCLDMIDGRVVKGKKFDNIGDVDNPEYLAQQYCKAGADEIVIYDITASIEKRKTDLESIIRATSNISIPFCIGGGISTIEDFENCIKAGASKVSINSVAVRNPNLIKDMSTKFGSEKVVLAMDVKKKNKGSWNVYLKGGKEDTGLDAIEWAKKGVKLGAGELVINSIDGDGTKEGYDIELLKKIKDSVNVPIVASGGAGKLEDFYNVIVSAKVDGVLAASVFHFGEIEIKDLKKYLKDRGIDVKL
ncbi:MAG: imidazole glycerol phosphate synthase subunit HisF [Tissierellia bacterium]|nr:imidazole glycerol phosphate synthase subunit HisF [Tissierellia bacterium]